MFRIVLASGFIFAASFSAADDKVVDEYNTKVAPLLRKYCTACHNEEDREGELVLDSYDTIFKGGENGAVITPRHSEQSRLIRVLTGAAKPAMPPEDSDKPSEEEIAVLKGWIDAGAKGPSGSAPSSVQLVTPKIDLTVDPRKSISSVSVSTEGGLFAIARYGEVELRTLDGKKVRQLADHAGNVNDVQFSSDGKVLLTAAGEAGLFGECRLWNVGDGQLVKTFQGHRDSLYAADLSPDGRLLATASYDQTVKLWNVENSEELHTLSGHNGAVYDVVFHPGGKILATASDDRTVKLWDVANGKRLDTFSQSLKELYTLAFSPNGRRLAAAGVDNRIRVWRISKTGKEGTNRLLFSRFAHESPILRLAYSNDGRMLVSSGEDRLIKVWSANKVTIQSTFQRQSDWVTGLAIASKEQKVLAGRLDGTFDIYDLSTGELSKTTAAQSVDEHLVAKQSDKPLNIEELPKVSESEPNDSSDQATVLSLPTVASGRIYNESDPTANDEDLFAFEAKAGDQWFIETNAARSKSPLDTKIEVLNAEGSPVQRLLLRAVRDSEITFRGINSEQLNCRVTNWEEMQLNQYLYIGGEVVKLFRAPRGPDSGFNFYPNTGKRYCYFGTSARSHALGESCYIVEPYTTDSSFADNGLPIFPLYYENDDESRQTLGKDSRLRLTVPSDGKYLVRVSDVRGFAGEEFNYQLIIRRPKPDFKVTLHGTNPSVNAGSGKEFRLQVERIDNYYGPIRVDITGIPSGFSVTSPIVIQEGHIEAWGVLNVHPSAVAPTEENWSMTKVTATALIDGNEVTHEVNNLGTTKLAEKPKLIAYLDLNAAEPTNFQTGEEFAFPDVPELTIAPGSSVTCQLRVDRNGFDKRIQFDVNNLPHGVIVEDIGLSGVLIPEGETERTVFLRAEEWVSETSRLFHAVAKVEGNQVTLPVLLHVRRNSGLTAVDGSTKSGK